MENQNMKTLKFKNVGKFAEEGSNRYESIVDNKFKVRIFKDSYYEKGFVFEFLTMNNISLTLITNDCLSSFWSKATKKQAIKRVEEIVNDIDCYNKIINYVNYENNNTR